MAGNRDYLERERTALVNTMAVLEGKIKTKEAEEKSWLDRIQVGNMMAGPAKTAMIAQSTAGLNTVRAELITLRSSWQKQDDELSILVNKIDDYDRSINDAIREGAGEGEAQASADRELDNFVAGSLADKTNEGDPEANKKMITYVVIALIFAILVGAFFYFKKSKK